MNISILSLISSSLISKSPVFVSNQMIVANCHFQKFTSLLFYNQPFYHLHKTIFNKGLGEIVKFENVINKTEDFITDDPFYGNYSRVVYHDPITEPITTTNSIKAAHIITFCQFIGIESNNSIIQMNKMSSSYFSDVLFYNCSVNQHLIKFDHSRCNTMTHICSYNNKVQSGAEFIYSDFSLKDFFIIIYSTFVGSNTKSLSFIESKSGSQYFKCLNFSKYYSSENDAQVITIDAPYCCSSTYISFNDINKKLYKISGSIARGTENETDKSSNKTVYFESIVAWNQMHEDFFRLSMTDGNSFFLSVSNSVFISSVIEGTKTFVVFDDPINNKINNFIILTNCQFSKNIKAYDSVPANFFMDADSFVTLDEENIIKQEIAVFTTLYCNGIGNPDNPKIAHGCQVDNCVAQERCNSTIGIPADAAPYETLIHTDLQTGTFTATSLFSSSNAFSLTSFFTKTSVFSYTDDFTKSNFFSSSTEFSGTDKFSRSQTFSKSSLFSNSNDFTNSIKFSNSIKFTQTNQFSESTYFTKSTTFSYSSDFTKSTMFSKSSYFTETTQFSSSFYFTKTTQFSSSIFFSESTQFSGSFYFSKSFLFSESVDFTKSTSFSDSSDFSKSFYFSKSSMFSKTIGFSNSNYFSESVDFTKSISFSDSSDFSKSFYFSQSTMFSKSKGFSYTFYFSLSDEFSKTDFFSKSTVFTISLDFTQSNIFTPSDDWNRTHTFSPSNYFSSSKQFSNSVFFSLSNDFTKTGDFSRSITFTCSNLFTNSFDFTKSNIFLKSSEFSKSEHFSSSFYFSKSNKFEKTNEFTQTKYFTYSTLFSNSDYFSKSSIFIYEQTTNFSNSKIFTISRQFTGSKMFTNSKQFTGSKRFTNSNNFSISKIFSKSLSFSPTITFIEKSAVIINIKTEKSNGMSNGVKIGLGTAFGALALVALIIGFILLRRRKIGNVENIDEEQLELYDDETTSMITQNPLMALMDDDDPFEAEFQ